MAAFWSRIVDTRYPLAGSGISFIISLPLLGLNYSSPLELAYGSYGYNLYIARQDR
jgi:hypothetical protein